MYTLSAHSDLLVPRGWWRSELVLVRAEVSAMSAVNALTMVTNKGPTTFRVEPFDTRAGLKSARNNSPAASFEHRFADPSRVLGQSPIC